MTIMAILFFFEKYISIFDVLSIVVVVDNHEQHVYMKDSHSSNTPEQKEPSPDQYLTLSLFLTSTLTQGCCGVS